MSLRCVRRPKTPYWIIRGIRVEESSGTADRTRAEEIRAAREAEIITQSVFGRAATATFAEACRSYLETGGRDGEGGEGRFMSEALEHFGVTPLAKIGLAEIEAFAARAYPRASAATRDRQAVTPVVAVLRHAAKRRMCAMPIIERPKKKKPAPRWLSLQEADKLIEHASGHMRPLIIFLIYTGARIGEALWLDWRNVDLGRAHVAFVHAPQREGRTTVKTGRSRGVPLHPRVVAALADLKHREGEVFRRPDGKPYTRPTKINDTSAGSRINTAFQGACERARIDGFRVHDCRHTWATWHYAINRDLGALQRLGGWKTLSMVMRYAHVNVEELQHTIDRLPAGGNLGGSETRKAESA